jgi:hypothetical protein
MKREIISVQQVAQAIRFVREEKILLDFDRARLCGVTSGSLNKAVRHKRERFPTEKPRREIGFHVREKTSRYRVRKR